MILEILKEVYTTFKPGIFAAILGILGLLLLVPVVTYILFAKDLGSKESIMNRNDAGVTLLDRNNKPFFTFYQAKQKTFVPLSTIPKSMQQAVVASEDREFYQHPGFSLRGIVRSVFTDIKAGGLSSGGSTLTQQLVKNALLNPKKNFLRKYQEIVLAAEIERRYSKNEILEMYLNSVYFGEGAFGVEQAAEIYFGIHAQDLSLAQSALLVGLLPAPSSYSPISNGIAIAKNRQKIVLDKMISEHYITSTEAAQAEQTELQFQGKKEELNLIAPHFALMVKQYLIDQYGEGVVARSGFKVKTTLNLDWQKYAEQVVENQVKRLAVDKVSNGAAVVMDPKTGEVMALVGSHDWYDTENGKVNMATQPRQPGSSFKPLVYAAALDQKFITPGSILMDETHTFPGGYTPHDYDNKNRGPVLVRRALANSLNIPAVEVMEKVGVDQAIEYGKHFGITTLADSSNYGLSMVLGAAEVPLIEMTDAYAVFAANGFRHPVQYILSIQDKNGKNIYQEQTKEETVIPSSVSYIISSILSDNNARLEEFGTALNISRPAAVKTGTTENYRDALTIGYTPSLVVGVWVGNNDNSSMDRVAGSLGAAPIWKSLMEHFLAGTKVETFEKPSDIVAINICKERGLLVKDATTSAQLENFIRGTEPTQLCFDSTPTPMPSATGKPTDTIQSTPTTVPTTQPTIAPTNTPGVSVTPSPFTTQVVTPIISIP